MMASLAQLSTELLDAIVVLLQRPDLARLARSCKKLQRHATPSLYHSISWTWTGGEPGPCVPPLNPPIRLLLRSVLANAELAKLIKAINFQAVKFRVRHQVAKSPFNGPAPDRTTLAKVRDVTRQIHNGVAWLKAVQHGHVGATITLLIMLLPDLRSLSLGPDLQQSNAFLAPALLHMLANSNGPKIWKHLRRLDLGTDIEGNDHRHWSIALPFSQFMPFFYLPSLESANMMFPGSFDAPNRAENRFPGNAQHASLPWPLPGPSAPALTSLCLKRSHAEPSILKALTAVTPQLKRLEYDYRLHYYLTLDTKELLEALNNVQNTLEHLVVGFTPYSPEAADPGEQGDRIITGALGSLKRFRRLQSLEISLTVLLGWYVQSAKALGDVLPLGLRSVTIRDDCSGFDDWEWWDEASMDAFSAFLESDWREATPLLDSFNVRMVEDSEDPRSLPDLCKMQGIDCNMYIGRYT